MALRPFGIVLILALAATSTAYAQAEPPPPTGPTEDPADTARVRIGPLFLQPEFGLKNVGLDNNVFNDPADPQRDWTGTLALGMHAGLRYGQARLTVKTTTNYVYYAHFREERAIDGHTRYQFEIRNPRIRPWIAFDKVKSHERSGFEIDSRAGRSVPTYEAGLEAKLGFRLSTRLVAFQRKVAYQEEERFRGVDLADTLDTRTDQGALQVLYEVSPLSSLRLGLEMSRIRFDTASIRNADDRAVYIGLEGRRDAGMEGTVDIGWKDRKPADPRAPSFSGLVARGSGAVVFAEQVRVAFGLDRDPQWSYEEAYTFYVQSGASTTITWRPYQRFDIQATGRHYWLDYRHGLDDRAVLRTDKIYSYGGGIGIFLRGYPGTRLGIGVEQAARESQLEDRNYRTLRYLTNVGFSF